MDGKANERQTRSCASETIFRVAQTLLTKGNRPTLADLLGEKFRFPLESSVNFVNVVIFAIEIESPLETGTVIPSGVDKRLAFRNIHHCKGLTLR
jgi:hypothetical protein